MCPAKPSSFMPSVAIRSKAVATTLPYFAFQVSVLFAPSDRSIPRGNFQRLVSRSVWKSMFRPTMTDPSASGHTTRVHIGVTWPFFGSASSP